ncbi:MAG: prolipoprotein diacylglyceryl transferase [Firmicutes bacterium]|nr:prolipoprotein diacylglyceryl transferase [Bacillota bacterium]
MYPWIGHPNEKFAFLDLYWILIFVGLAIGYVLALKFRKRAGINERDIDYSLAAGLILGFVGTKFFSFVFRMPELFADGHYHPEVADKLMGGLMFYGGLIGAMLGVYLYARIAKRDWLKIYDYAAVFLPFGYAFGRLGCFCAGCCFGSETSAAWGFKFVGRHNSCHIPGIHYHFPVQLLDALISFAFFGVMLWLLLSGRAEKRGLRSVIYIYGYAIIRFCLEFLRGDDAARGGLGAEGGKFALSTSQFISILMVVFATLVLLFFVLKIGRNKSKKLGVRGEEFGMRSGGNSDHNVCHLSSDCGERSDEASLPLAEEKAEKTE